MTVKKQSETKAAGGSQTNKIPDPMKGKSNKVKDKEYNGNFHNGLKNMTLNDLNNIVLDIEDPWMNIPSFFTQKVEKELAQVVTI